MWSQSKVSNEEQTRLNIKTFPILGRNILALEEGSEYDYDIQEAEIELSETPDSEEVVTSKIEIIPSENGSLKQCVPPAVEQFPNPLLDKQSRQRGGILLHIFVAFYMFVGLAIVCEDYFVPSLNKASDGKPGKTIS